MNEATKLYNKYGHKISRDNNIGLVRYILAIAVLVAHFNILCDADIPWFVTSYDAVCGFFTLSGFLLIYPLLSGKSLRQFVIDRAWRLLPSYLFVVVIGAVLLSLISSLPSKEYFLSKDFWIYILTNVGTLNFLHPTLPGVFTGFAEPAVNGSLWTIKIEWQLSLSVPIFLFFIKKYKLNLRKTIVFILVSSIIYQLLFLYLYESQGKQIYNILSRQLFGQLVFFYSGVMLYTFYVQLKNYNYKPFLIIVILFFVYKFSPLYDSPLYYIVYPFILSFFVISASLIPNDIAKKYIDRGHNISYEIYLCHFPILQTLAYFNIKDTIGQIPTLLLAFVFTLIASVVTYAAVGHIYTSKKRKRAIKTQLKTI